MKKVLINTDLPLFLKNSFKSTCEKQDSFVLHMYRIPLLSLESMECHIVWICLVPEFSIVNGESNLNLQKLREQKSGQWGITVLRIWDFWSNDSWKEEERVPFWIKSNLSYVAQVIVNNPKDFAWTKWFFNLYRAHSDHLPYCLKWNKTLLRETSGKKYKLYQYILIIKHFLYTHNTLIYLKQFTF